MNIYSYKKPGMLQSMGSQRVRQDSATEQNTVAGLMSIFL